ncbi:multidrug-resistance type transporter aminotriazole resistance [Gnomoniopsis smithogilvyi]|uniref:Multidrug-resistance type transporter aminotriazole resistance n=1 Tax=Gnomoniopsis smithogilvyi TaxID=1191159 RepID=A0A9W9CZ01_9PEZI|nr:multidrug-resistance type transporter aminotriazole resistance [Gnomoniopsis smithogilvyi]
MPDHEDTSTGTTTPQSPSVQYDGQGISKPLSHTLHSDSDQEGDPETLHRSKSTRSIAETLPWYRELLFVAVICLGQLYTQAGLGQTLSIIHVIGETWGLEESPDLSWLIAGYSLTVGTFILFSGRLGDLFGYKTIYLIGMSWYSLWSLVCGLAVYSNHVLFVFGRVLQGIGPALILPNGLAILGATYAPGKKKSLAFAAFAATAPAGSVIGATFSGLFALKWWPWTFWTFSIVLAATVALAYVVIPPVPSSHRENRPNTNREMIAHLDIPGALTGVIGLILINFSWNQAPIAGWQEPYVYVTLIIGIIFIAAYFLIEIRYAKHPLVPFDALSSDVAFVLGAVACGWGSFGIWVWYTWQFLLELRGNSPLLGSASFVPVVISGALAAAVVGLLLHRAGPPLVMLLALVAFTIGSILMATCPIDQTYWAQSFVSFVITPWGMDMSFPAATILLSNAVAREHQGIAASLVNTVVNYSIALGLGIAGTVEYQINNGGTTQAEKLKGYRGSYYLGIGIAGLGVVICSIYLIKSKKDARKKQQGEKH